MKHKKILILGASSAVAGEIATRLRKNECTLFLIGRSERKLSALVKSMGAAQSDDLPCEYEVSDFNDLESTERVIKESWERFKGFDVVFICHGLLGSQIDTEKSYQQAKSVIDTNFVSVVAQLVTLSQLMLSQGGGKIAITTSVAGDRGRPRNFTYGAAKGALSLYLQGLRSAHFNSGLEIYDFKLGPVDTPMTLDHKKDFTFSTSEQVAEKIVKSLSKKTYVVYVPAYWKWVMLLVRNLPEGIFQRLKFLSGR